MTVIQILGGSYPTQTVFLSGNQLKVERADGGSRTYYLPEAVVSIQKASEVNKKIIFEMELRDNKTIRGETGPKVFHQLNKYVGAGTGANYVLKEQDPTTHSRTKKSQAVMTWIVLGTVVGLTVYACSNDDGPKKPKAPKAATQWDAQVMAPVLCEERVKETLKAPRTAKFPMAKDVSFDGRTALLTSYVDAQNGFGAMIRTHYVCSVQYNGGDPNGYNSWTIKEFVVSE